MKNIITLFFIALLAGCVAVGTPINKEQFTSFKVGVTTQQDVIAILGKATVTSQSSDGVLMLVYSYYEGGFGKTRIEQATIFFGATGKMTEFKTSETNIGN